MQVLKEEVKQSILDSGKAEFLKNGFEKTSMRQIAKSAGTTIGNLYNYFSSKEEIFYTITTPAFDEFISLLNNHEDESFKDFTFDESVNIDFLETIIKFSFNKYDSMFDSSFLILVDGSKGTKYEDIKSRFIDLLSEHLSVHIKDINISNTNEQNHFGFCHAVASGFIEGMMDILRCSYSKEEKKNLLTEYVLFYITGVFNITANR